MLESFLPGAGHLQNLHPLVVHFPIALVYAAALLYFIAWILARESLQWTALWMLGLGTLGAGVSLATGLYSAPSVMISESVREQLLRRHEHLMVTASILTGLLTLWALAARPMPVRGRFLFLIGLLALLGIIAAGADLGGRMVYEYNAGGSGCAQPIDFRK